MFVFVISKTKKYHMDIHSILLDSVLYLETKFNLKEKLEIRVKVVVKVNKCFYTEMII